VKDNREEGNSQRKSQDVSSSTVQTSANKADANHRGGDKRKVKSGKVSHAATGIQRK
jgi:hypothetical protein